MKRYQFIRCHLIAIVITATATGCISTEVPQETRAGVSAGHPAGPRPSATHPHKLTYGPAGSVRMNPRILEQAATELEDAVNSGDIDGAVLLVARHGRVVLHRAFGKRDGNVDPAAPPVGKLSDGSLDPDPSAPMPIHGIFDLASMTKPLTAFLALKMDVDAHRYPDFSIDDLVSDYIPDFATDPRKARMRLRDLMRHASGSSIDTAQALYDPSANPDPWAHMIAEPLATGPGEAVLYSDLGYRLLGYILQEVAGADLDDAMKAEILHPMGMMDTSFRPYAEQYGKRARFIGNKYSSHRGYYPRGEVIDDNDQYAETYVLGSSGQTYDTGCDGLFSTAWDLALFQQMMLNRGLHVVDDACASPGTARRPDGSCESDPIRIAMLPADVVDAMTAIQTLDIPNVPAQTDEFVSNLLLTHKAYGWEKPEPGAWPGGDHYTATTYSKTGGAGTLVVAHPDPALDYFFILLTNRGYPDYDYYVDENGELHWPDFEDLITDMHAEQIGNIIHRSLIDVPL